MKIVQLKRNAALQQYTARCNVKQHEKNEARKKCYGTSRKKMQYEKSATRKKCNPKKRCSMKRKQHVKSATWKKGNSK